MVKITYGKPNKVAQGARKLLIAAGLAAVVGGAAGAGVNSALTQRDYSGADAARLKTTIAYKAIPGENEVIFEDSSGQLYTLRCSQKEVPNSDGKATYTFLEPFN